MTTAPRPYFHDVAPSGNWWTVTPTPPPPWTRPPFYPPISAVPLTFVFQLGTATLALDVHAGDAPPPSGWETVAFDDSAWGHAVQVPINDEPPGQAVDPQHIWWALAPTMTSSSGDDPVFRHHCALPSYPFTVTAAHLDLTAHENMNGAYINGTFIAGTVANTNGLFGPVDTTTSCSVPVDASLFVSGDNIWAVGASCTMIETPAGAPPLTGTPGDASLVGTLTVTLVPTIYLARIDPTHGPAAGGSTAPTLSTLSPSGGPASGGNNRPPLLTSLEP